MQRRKTILTTTCALLALLAAVVGCTPRPKGTLTIANLAGVHFARAAEGFSQACNSGEAMSCLRLGLMYRLGDGGIAPDEIRSLELIEQACSMGLPTACELLETTPAPR